jgi:hypothetical protein
VARLVCRELSSLRVDRMLVSCAVVVNKVHGWDESDRSLGGHNQRFEAGTQLGNEPDPLSHEYIPT